MAWSFPANNTGLLVRPDADTTFVARNFSSHEIMIAEAFGGGGSIELVRFRNDGGGNYLVTVRAAGSPLVRFHGDTIN